MKYYIEVEVSRPDESTTLRTFTTVVEGLTIEATSLQHAMGRFSDFSEGVNYGGNTMGVLTAIRTKPTRGIEYKELLK